MNIKAIPLLGSLVLLGGTLLASEYEKRTEITLNEAVIVAGVPVVTLEPGEYVIRLMNHDHNRNIVQIFNKRENHLYTTVLAIPNYRLFPKDKTTFSFHETPLGNPPALKAWFAPGDNWGQEFVYPKGLAAKLARESGQPVLTATAETVEELSTAPITEVTKAGEEQPLEEAFTAPEPAAAAPEPAPAVAEVAVAEPEPEPELLPATGSPFFAFGLAGLFAAAAGLTIRRLAVSKS